MTIARRPATRFRAVPYVLSALVLPASAGAQSDVAFPAEVYAARRAALVAALGTPVVVPGEYMIRHEGVKKQDPNFFYLTGVESPYAILVVVPDPAGRARAALFLPGPRDFAGAQYPHQDPRLVGAAWNRM
ncbi:MAG TPA: aminopeptidase P N-terminal domain-containing protein, partial [Longimicrobiales bacterium]|nr:aminopeptidase P N-terminal domain-containing protein [Longimicrobiales bacterium]